MLWAGSLPLVISHRTETDISTTIPASVLGDVGVVQISVTVPGPGGGQAGDLQHPAPFGPVGDDAGVGGEDGAIETAGLLNFLAIIDALDIYFGRKK